MSGWRSKFTPPIPIPDGGNLTTLSDARAYILKLPAATQATTPWQTAAGELLKAADPPGNGPWIDFARIGMMQALYPNPPEREPRRKAVKTFRILK